MHPWQKVQFEWSISLNRWVNSSWCPRCGALRLTGIPNDEVLLMQFPAELPKERQCGS